MYTTNPAMPRIRREAAALFKKGWSARKIGRYLGFHHTAVMKWVKKAKVYGYNPIPTQSSKPKRHPKQLPDELVWKIFHTRLKSKRSSEVIHRILQEGGVLISLSSVKRTLDRLGLLKKRIYTFTLIDVCSRWTYARTYQKMNAATSVLFVEEAQRAASFHFEMLQSDHGPEFGKWFVERIQKKHRYSRIGKPNDNAHIERFNRTVQEECLDKVERTPEAFNAALKTYLPWYNEQRHHFGLNLKTPAQILSEVVPSY